MTAEFEPWLPLSFQGRGTRLRRAHKWRLARRCARRKPGVLFRGSNPKATE